ncbi:MAG: hypothetical protein WCS65_12770 [Verrucomicrobiae bacterium]
MAFCFCSAARAQISVSAAQAGSGEYVYEAAKDPNGFEQDAQDWNAAFQDLGSNVKANALISDGAAPVFYVANALPKDTAMDMVMTFDFSQSGHHATKVSGGHWMQSFSPGEVQPYYQRFYSINGGKEILIDQSPSWGKFPNSGDAKATGFFGKVGFGSAMDAPLNFPEPARTFTYRISVKFQNRQTGEESEVRPLSIQAVRTTGDPRSRREPMTLKFSLATAQK